MLAKREWLEEGGREGQVLKKRDPGKVLGPGWQKQVQ